MLEFHNSKIYKLTVFQISTFGRLFLSLLLLVSFWYPAYSQKPAAVTVHEKTTEGTEFWLCFQRNYKDTPLGTVKSKNDLRLELFLTGSTESKVSVEIDGLGFRRELKIAAGTVTNLIIDPNAQVKGEEINQRLAVHVVSDNPISVYGLNSRWQTTDTYLGLPVSVL